VFVPYKPQGFGRDNMKTLYSKKRAYQQVATGAFKSKIHNDGEVLNFTDIIEDSFTNNNGNQVPNDSILCVNSEGKKIKLPVREYLKMNTKDNEQHFSSEGDSDVIKLPASITIVSGEGREDRNGNPIYPIFAYKLAEDFLAEGSDLEWDDLVAGGLKDEHPFDQVQNYTVAIN